jgi:hypothetical protein
MDFLLVIAILFGVGALVFAFGVWLSSPVDFDVDDRDPDQVDQWPESK